MGQEITRGLLLMNSRNELIKLIKERAYRKGEFKLSSGKTSEHYINCKPVTLEGEGLHLITYLMKKLILIHKVSVEIG